MEYHGMVHALEEIRRLLKSSGLLIDLHPHPNWLYLQAKLGGEILAVEPMPQSYSQDVHQAEAALAEVTGRGLYTIEENAEFDFMTYASTVDEIRSHWEAINAYDDSPTDQHALPLEESQDERFRQVLAGAGGDAEIVVHERARIARLRPSPGKS
jgi:hypothetical protein